MARVLTELVHHLGRAATRGGLADLADGELLRRFADDRDPLAFETLVRRHGPMVLAACGRVLGRGGDAEDAFQATFLTLVRHARSVRAGDSLAGWLYRTARRVGVRASRRRAGRVRRECRAARPEAVAADDVERADWWAALDREVERLPRAYREAFVLCHLEGRPHEAAARELGCPLGTLHSRLARAKERLRASLGAVPVLAAAVVSARLAHATASAAAGLAEGAAGGTVGAILAFSHGVWNPMTLIRTKLAVVALSAAAVVGPASVLTSPPAASATAPQPPSRPADPALEELRRENERLRREVAELRQQLAAARRPAVQLGDGPPADADVLRALPRVAPGVYRDDVVIVKNKLVDQLGPPVRYPIVGAARLRHRHWECAVYYTERGPAAPAHRTDVVYLDQDVLVPEAPGER